MHDEGCTCMVHPRPPCSWCENGGDSCKTCQGDGEVFNNLKHLTNCTDCGATGIDPKYHKPECECGACKEPEPLRSMDPDGENLKALNPPAVIGMDFGKEPAAVAVSEADYREWPEISERYLKMMRKKSADAFFRKQLFQDWTPARVADLPNHAADAFAYITAAQRAAVKVTGVDKAREPSKSVGGVYTKDGFKSLDDWLAQRKEDGHDGAQHTGVWFDEVADIDLDKMARELLPQPEPTRTVPRICGWKREDRQEPATVHQLSDDIGQLPVATPDHRTGWKP